MNLRAVSVRCSNQIIMVPKVLSVCDRAVKRYVLVVPKPTLNNVSQEETIGVVVVGWVVYEPNVSNADKLLYQLNIQLLGNQEVIIPHSVSILWSACGCCSLGCVDVQDIIAPYQDNLIYIKSRGLIKYALDSFKNALDCNLRVVIFTRFKCRSQLANVYIGGVNNKTMIVLGFSSLNFIVLRRILIHLLDDVLTHGVHRY